MAHSRTQECVPNTLKRASATHKDKKKKKSLPPEGELFLIAFSSVQIHILLTLHWKHEKEIILKLCLKSTSL